MDPVVINGVECLGRVKKKEEAVNLLFHPFVEEAGDIESVATARPTRQEPFLCRVDQLCHSRHDTTGYGCSENPVVRISDTEGPSIRDKASALFWKEV